MSEIQEVFRKGCLIDLDVGVWLAERKLQPEDLGLTKEEVSTTFSLGHKRLISLSATSRIRKLETLARVTLDKYSFDFPFGGARFVPRVRLQECIDKLDEIVKDFNLAADELVADYNNHRLAMRSEFTQIAHDAFHRSMLLCGQVGVGEDKYVNDFLARIDKVYPSTSELRRKYHIGYVVFQVELPDLTRATYADIVDDSAKIQLMKQAFETSIRNSVESFSESVVLQMRSDVTNVLSRAIRTLKVGQRPTKYTINMVRKMIDRYSLMDLVGDESFRMRLADFKTRVLDVYSDVSIIKDSELKGKVVTELEALQLMATDEVAVRALIEKYRKELFCK